MTYVGAWRPVSFALQQDRARSHSNLPKSPTSRGNAESSFAKDISKSEVRVVDTGRFYTFNQFVSDSVRRAAFERFLMKAFAIENLCFFDSILQYEEMVTTINEDTDPEVQRSNAFAAALTIFKQYIASDAVLMVNISFESKRPFENAFAAALKAGNLDDYLNNRPFQWHESLNEFSIEVLRSVYEKPFSEVLAILMEDLFRKFKNTPEYKACSIGILETVGTDAPRSPSQPVLNLNRKQSSAESRNIELKLQMQASAEV
jgi:hypothetical protein